MKKIRLEAILFRLRYLNLRWDVRFIRAGIDGAMLAKASCGARSVDYNGVPRTGFEGGCRMRHCKSGNGP